MDTSIKRKQELPHKIGKLCQKGAAPERLRIDNMSVQESLRKQQKEHHVIFDSVRTAIWCIDNKGQVSLVNRAGVSFLDIAKEDIVGRYIDELFLPDKMARLMADLIETINSGKSKMGIIEKYTLSSSKERWVQSDKIPHYGDSGEIIGMRSYS